MNWLAGKGVGGLVVGYERNGAVVVVEERRRGIRGLDFDPGDDTALDLDCGNDNAHDQSLGMVIDEDD